MTGRSASWMNCSMVFVVSSVAFDISKSPSLFGLFCLFNFSRFFSSQNGAGRQEFLMKLFKHPRQEPGPVHVVRHTRRLQGGLPRRIYLRGGPRLLLRRPRGDMVLLRHGARDGLRRVHAPDHPPLVRVVGQDAKAPPVLGDRRRCLCLKSVRGEGPLSARGEVNNKMPGYHAGAVWGHGLHR